MQEQNHSRTLLRQVTVKGILLLAIVAAANATNLFDFDKWQHQQLGTSPFGELVDHGKLAYSETLDLSPQFVRKYAWRNSAPDSKLVGNNLDSLNAYLKPQTDELQQSNGLYSSDNSLDDNTNLDEQQVETVGDGADPQLAQVLSRQVLSQLQDQANRQQNVFQARDAQSIASEINTHLPPDNGVFINQLDVNKTDNEQLMRVTNEEIDSLISQLANNLNQLIPNSNARNEALQQQLASYVASTQQHLSRDDPNSELNNLNAITANNALDLINARHNKADELDASAKQAVNNDSDDDDQQQVDKLTASIENQLIKSQAGSEFIDTPLLLNGHQLVQGGAGEGRQLLGPEGSFENAQVVKSDRALSGYCDPPNPCPLGFTKADGCIEHFVNTASFSREYQSKRDCGCDNEHSLFNCESPIQVGGR